MFGIFALFATLILIFLAVGWAIAGSAGALIALVLAIIINFIAYWNSDKFAISAYRAVPANDPRLAKAVDKLVRESKIPRPKLYIVKSPVPNAFATGRNPQHSAIAVTEGLLKLTDDELEGVLAHEIAHIRNRDTLVSVLAATIAGTISYIAMLAYYNLVLGGRREGGNQVLYLFLMIIFAPLAALLVKLAISRSREYSADRSAAGMTKKPEALASALRKISSAPKSQIQGPAATSHLWIVNPFKGDWFHQMFSTHPPIERRIERLERIHSGEPEPPPEDED